MREEKFDALSRNDQETRGPTSQQGAAAAAVAVCMHYLRASFKPPPLLPPLQQQCPTQETHFATGRTDGPSSLFYDQVQTPNHTISYQISYVMYLTKVSFFTRAAAKLAGLRFANVLFLLDICLAVVIAVLLAVVLAIAAV